MTTLLLVAAALLPAVVLCVYVYCKDRVEKEPVGLLVKLLIFGALSCFPAAFIETILGDWIDKLFLTSSVYVYNFVKYFFGVAIVEEACKYFILVKVTAKNREFNSLFDGLIYSIFVSLGFAALENVFYVLSNGFGNAVARAFLSVPGHMFFAVMMGYYYSIWHINSNAAAIEESLVERGLLAGITNPFETKKHARMCLIVPTLAHGLYNFCCSLGTGWAIILLLAFVIYMYVTCFKRIKQMSKADTSSFDISRALVARKHPELIEYI